MRKYVCKFNVSCLRQVYASCSDVVNPTFCPVLFLSRALNLYNCSIVFLSDVLPWEEKFRRKYCVGMVPTCQRLDKHHEGKPYSSDTALDRSLTKTPPELVPDTIHI